MISEASRAKYLALVKMIEDDYPQVFVCASGVETEDDWDHFNDIYPELNSRGYEMVNGVTRWVIKDETGDYVIKFPRDGKLEASYCYKEVEAYKNSKKSSVNEFFAECDLLCEVESRGVVIPIIIMEKCYVDEDMVRESWVQSAVDDGVITLDEADDYYEKYYDSIDAVEDMMRQEYGEDEYLKLVGFLADSAINDIHDQNVGRSFSGKLVIIDYAGF